MEWQTVKTLIQQSDLGLDCLPRHVCPKTLDHYCNFAAVKFYTSYLKLILFLFGRLS